jgi:twitching motility two-component system response regulator PilH
MRSVTTSTPEGKGMARILLIEDSPTDTAVLTQWLERHGYEVLAAANAEDGIALCRSERPDLVLMDVVLPGMSGFQATRALVRDPQTAAIPVVIVSTKGMETDRMWGLRQGAKGYLVKPPTEVALIAQIRQVLGG